MCVLLVRQYGWYRQEIPIFFVLLCSHSCSIFFYNEFLCCIMDHDIGHPLFILLFLSFIFFFFSQIFFRLLDILRVAKLTWLFVMVLLMVKQWFSFFFFNGPVLFFALLYAVLFCSNWSSWHGWICSVPAYTSGKSWFLIDHPMSFLGTTSYSE